MNKVWSLTAVFWGPGQQQRSSSSSALVGLLQPGRSSSFASSASWCTWCLSEHMQHLLTSGTCPGINPGKPQGPTEPCQSIYPLCVSPVAEPHELGQKCWWIISQCGIFLLSNQVERFYAVQVVVKEKTNLYAAHREVLSHTHISRSFWTSDVRLLVSIWTVRRRGNEAYTVSRGMAQDVVAACFSVWWESYFLCSLL